MATVSLTPDTPSGGDIATIHPSTAYPLLHGARLPVTQHEGTFHESAFTEGRYRIRTNPKNPTGEGRVLVQGTTAALFRTNSDDFQGLIAQTNRYGGTLTYTPTSGTAISYQVVEINLGDVEPDLEHSETRAVFPFTFECRPYGLLASQAISITGGTLTGPCDYMNLPDVPGHVSALATLELTDVSSQNHDHVEFGLEMDGYNSSSATDLILAKTDMNVTGLAGASNAGLAGDYTGTVWRATLFTSPLAVCSTGTQTHQGKRRIRARVAAQGTGPVYVRLAWRVGDGPWGRNPWTEVSMGIWSEPSLGSIYVPLGESWEGRVEAKSANNATDTIDVDVLFPMPAEVWGKSSRLAKEQTANVLSAYDTFLQTAGDLTAKNLPLGGTWAEAGDAVGLVLDTANDTVTRTEVSDASTANFSGAHYALAGVTDYAATQAEITAKATGWEGSEMGVVARYVDASNFITAHWYLASSYRASLYVYKVVAGTATLLASATGYVFPPNVYRAIRLEIDALGRWDVAVTLPGGSTWYPGQLSGQDSVLATAGALASGQAGIFDRHTSANAVTRTYDDFLLSAPATAETPTALYSGQSMRFTYDGAERENSTGTRWGSAPSFTGQHLLIPAAGREDRTSRIAILTRRFDVDAGLPSDGLSDAMTATLTVIPRVLFDLDVTWLAANIDVPEGRMERYGPDEPGDGTLIECSFDTQMPGGFGSGSLTIPRDPEVSAGETSRYLLAPVTIYGQAGDVAWDGRVADVGEVGIDAVQLVLEGWSAHLEDEKNFRCVYINRDLSAWTGMPLTRKLALTYSAANPSGPYDVVQDASTADDIGGPGLVLTNNGVASVGMICEAWLDMGPGEWASYMAGNWEFNGPTSDWLVHMSSVSDEDLTDSDTGADLLTPSTPAASGSADHTPVTQYRYARLLMAVGAAQAGEGDRLWTWRNLYVVGGSHDAPLVDDGILASDVIQDVIVRAAPLLRLGEIQPSVYPIPHLVVERTTPLAVIEQVSGLDGGEGLIPDWGVWEDREFFWTTAGTLGRTWRVRTEINADPQDEGPTAVGRASHVIVSYTDANGRELSVGPVGSGCDTETDELLDTDPENPYVRAGIASSLAVDAGTVQEVDGATLIGKLALREANADPRAGSINVIGEARDEDGHAWPAWKIRAGDAVVVESDADDPRPRRIGQTSFDGQHTLTATVSTPRSQLAVLLARLAGELEVR